MLRHTPGFQLIGLLLLSALTLLNLTGCADDTRNNRADDDTRMDAGDGADSDTHEPIFVGALEGDFHPRFDPTAGDFYRMPWPSDARLHPDGGVDLSDLPHASSNFAKLYITAVRAVHGFSTMPAIYIPFTQAEGLGADALPSPKQTLEADATIQLIDLSEEACGKRTPLEVVFDAQGGKFVDAQTLKISPVPGWVLRPATPYALIVTTQFGAPAHTTARTQAFADALNGEADDAALNRSFDPLRRCLPDTPLDAEEIAIATVFHTQDPAAETRAMREVVWSPSTPVSELTNWYLDEGTSNAQRAVYIAHAPFPIFQKGVPPYRSEGGMEFDASGLPIIQRWESVPFLVTVPPDHPGPLKLLIWSGGTGAVLGNHLNRRHWLEALANGFAIAEFVPQFHKFRGDGNFDSTMDSFNFLNPVAGRTGFRQQAAETSYFIRLLSEKVAHHPDLPPIDTERIFYGGHSQGSLVGSMVAGSEPRIDTYLFSGVAAYLTETILTRKDPFDIADLLQSLLQDPTPLDRFHPFIQMAQLGADVVDGQNYAPHWAGWPEHPGGSNIFIINGQHDDTTSVLGMNALLTAGDIHPVGHPGWNIDPYGLRDVETYPTPVHGNRNAFNGEPLTVGAYLHADTGHFTFFDIPEANQAGVNFWISSADGKAVIEY